jgi:hypothetical protein
LPGLERKARVVIDWTLDLFFPRDIVYLRDVHRVESPPALPLRPNRANEHAGGLYAAAVRPDRLPDSV